MSLTIGELVGYIHADESGMERGLANAERGMRRFQRDANGRLHDLNGRFVSEGAAMGQALGQGVGGGGERAERALGRITAAAGGLAEVSEEGDRAGLSLGRIAGMAGGLAATAAQVGMIGAQLGAAIPVAAGLVATLLEIAPAAAVGTTAMLAMRQASVVVKLAAVGMDDALSAALDPDKAEEFEEALKALSPEARQVALEVRALAPELRALQQEVQNEVFRGLADQLDRTGRAVLPVVRRELLDTATAVRSMALGVSVAARDLAESGTLGRAMGSASAGLNNLAGIPGLVLQAFVQLAAAAGPVFEDLMSGLAGAAGDVSEALTEAFESGALEEAIRNAVGLVGDLFEVLQNVGSIVGSVFGAAEVSGEGFLGTLTEITGAAADAFASPEVQNGLKALIGFAGTLAETAGPLLGAALRIVGRVLERLGPPAEQLAEALGDALLTAIEAAEPLLLVMADNVGILVDAAAPLLPMIGKLAAALLPAVTPLFEALGLIFADMGPVVDQLARVLMTSLAPILSSLPQIIGPLAMLIAQNLSTNLALFSELLVALQPSLVILGQSLADILIAAGPLILAFSMLAAELTVALMPILVPLIGLIGKLAALLAGRLARQVTTTVVPALQALTALLRGDFSLAWDKLKTAVGNSVRNVLSDATALPRRVIGALLPLGGQLWDAATDAGGELVSGLSYQLGRAVGKVANLPYRAWKALGDLSRTLYWSGRELIWGFINGIGSMFGEVGDAVGGLVDYARDFFPFSPAKRGAFSGRGYTLYSGQAIGQALAAGMASQQGTVAGAARALAGAAQSGLTVAGTSPAGLVPSAGAAAGSSAGGGQAGVVRVVFRVDGGDDDLKRLIRSWVSVDGGGDVQLAFGQ